MEDIPEFYIGDDEVEGVCNTSGFHRRIIEFIEDYVSGIDYGTTLCYLISSDGTMRVADLHRESFDKSLKKSLEFFIEEEDYEACKQIKQLTEKL
jgi:hypothetical protein